MYSVIDVFEPLIVIKPPRKDEKSLNTLGKEIEHLHKIGASRKLRKELWDKHVNFLSWHKKLVEQSDGF